jgi:hypothetical protein
VNGDKAADMNPEWLAYVNEPDKVPKTSEVRASGWYSGRE